MESSAESKDEGAGVNPNSFKPGQKFPTPSPGSGDRVFYDTLLQQRPDSEMAQEWCVSHGTLELEEAIKLYRIICKRKNKEFDYQPTAPTAPSVKKQSTSQRNSSGKSKIIDETNEIMDTGHTLSYPLSLLIPVYCRYGSIFNMGRTRDHRIVEILS